VGAAGPDQTSRYIRVAFEARDVQPVNGAMADGIAPIRPGAAELQIGQLRLQYMLDTHKDRDAYLRLPVARVSEVVDRRVVLDEGWIPPVMLVSATEHLPGLMQAIAGLLAQRADTATQRLAVSAGGAAAATREFVWLQTINRNLKLLEHWCHAGRIHPESVYCALVQMAGDLLTFQPASPRVTYPPYQHDDLQRSFDPVAADIRKALAEQRPSNVSQIELTIHSANQFSAQVRDLDLLRSAALVLIAWVSIPVERIQQQLPNNTAIGAIKEIRAIIAAQSKGVELRVLHQPPYQLAFHQGAAYFELEKVNSYFQTMRETGTIAIQTAGDFPGLRLELWAIRS
jgi:type VI secretion system protein ImpJ